MREPLQPSGPVENHLRDGGPPLLDAPPPCFYGRVCGGRAALEKQGKSVCPTCAARLKGIVYPLRAPTHAPLYPTSRALAEALDMVETDHKKRDRNDPVTGRPPSR